MQRRPDIDAAVAGAVAAVPAGAGRVLVVVGERGRGRTHAARAAARHAALAGLRVLALHPGDTPLDVPFAAVERLLQDAGGLPDAGAPAPDATVQAVHRLVRRLAGERPLALVVDDLDALDAASVRCVEHLAAAAADLA